MNVVVLLFRFMCHKIYMDELHSYSAVLTKVLVIKKVVILKRIHIRRVALLIKHELKAKTAIVTNSQ